MNIRDFRPSPKRVRYGIDSLLRGDINLSTNEFKVGNVLQKDILKEEIQNLRVSPCKSKKKQTKRYTDKN